jgi:hypothetical protein
MVVAERTEAPNRASIEVSPAVKKRYNDYKSELRQRFNRSATDSDLVGAFLDGVPAWQAEAMLAAYRPPAEPRKDSGSGD